MESGRIEKFGGNIAGAYKEISMRKWERGFLCKSCGHQDYFEGKFPYSRRCAKCKKDFSPTSDTVFHGVRFRLDIAVYVIKVIATSKERITSEKLTEELSTNFKQKLRQKTVWAFLMKVYSAMTLPIPEYSGHVTMVRFVHGGKTIIALKGSYKGTEVIAGTVANNSGDEVYSNIIRQHDRENVTLSAYDATFKSKLETRLRKRYRQMEVTLTSRFDKEAGGYSDRDFALNLYNAVAGVSPGKYQAYLNYYSYFVSNHGYDHLMSMLIPKS